MPLVFAYGSNLDPLQMVTRCPSARLACEARLPSARLAFVGYSFCRQGAVATVYRAKPSCEVPGLVWEISAADLVTLDAYEGTPRTYYRRRWRVVTPTGKRIAVHVYRARSSLVGLPSSHYFGLIARAYVARSFPTWALADALKLSGVKTKFGINGRRSAAA